MLENRMIRYLSVTGLLVASVLVFITLWISKLFPVALAFTGLLAVALTAAADSFRERDRELILDTTYQQEQKVMRPRFLCYGQGRNKKCA